jgi:hypothetical protein
MPYTISITPTAIEDIDAAIEYYNALAPDLGYRLLISLTRVWSVLRRYLPPRPFDIKMFAAKP